MGMFWRPEADPAAAGGAVPAPDLAQALTASAGRLEIRGGAAKMRISTDAALTSLYRISAQGPYPEVRENGGHVRVAVSRGLFAFDWRTRAVDIALNPSVPWAIDIAGGAWKVLAEIEELKLLEVTVSGGASDLELALPSPRGIVPIRFSGGASKMVVRRPKGSPARLVMTGGASKLSLDGIFSGGVGGRMELSTPDFPGAADAYDVSISGGASQVVISASG